MAQTKHNNGSGHETSDASLKAAVLLVALTAGLVVVGVVSMYYLFGYVVDHQASQDAPPSPLLEDKAPFIGPQLQVAPLQEMQDMKAAEQDVLDSYGWIDQKAGIVRIPIDRAMSLIAERGLDTALAPGVGEQE